MASHINNDGVNPPHNYTQGTDPVNDPTNPNTTTTDEKIAKPHDDSSSGNVENLEEAPGAHLMVVDKATERGVLRKLDYRIVPMVMWVYLMNMMDRGEFCS